MSKTRSMIIGGCGLGCGLILLVVFLLIGSGALFVRDTVRGFDNAVELRGELDERHGEPAGYVPTPDGTIAPDRIEAFLGAREAMGDARAEISALFTSFDMNEQRLSRLESESWWNQMREALSITRSALDVGPALGAFFEARNRALLAADIGYGEHAYLYAISYWSFLGIGADDGPRQVILDNEPTGRESTSVMAQPQILRRLRGELIAMLHNQRSLLDRRGEFDPAWRSALVAEIEALESDPERMPWGDGPPAAIRASLEPYRERLRATYDNGTNPFALARNVRRGRWTIQSE